MHLSRVGLHELSEQATTTRRAADGVVVFVGCLSFIRFSFSHSNPNNEHVVDFR